MIHKNEIVAPNLGNMKNVMLIEGIKQTQGVNIIREELELNFSLYEEVMGWLSKQYQFWDGYSPPNENLPWCLIGVDPDNFFYISCLIRKKHQEQIIHFH